MSPPWGPALGGAALVNLVTLIGVVLLGVPALRSTSGFYKRTTVTLSSGFAAGALLSTAFFLMLSESIELIEGGHGHDDHDDHDHRRRLGSEHKHDDKHKHDEHGHGHDHDGHEHDGHIEAVWQWGVMVLAGFCVVLLIDFVISAIKPSKQLSDAPAGDKYSTDVPDESPAPAKSMYVDAAAVKASSGAPIRRITFSILVGDAMHNFADGVFIATAFKLCNSTVGWAVVAGTVAHELAQELADFLVLTSVCGFRPVFALLFNFLSGLTVMVGAIVVLAAEMSNKDVGLILAFGAGIYIYNAAVECVPRLMDEPDKRIKAIGLALFVLGAVAIGLVLLGHEHCDDHGGHDDHDKHGHDKHGH